MYISGHEGQNNHIRLRIHILVFLRFRILGLTEPAVLGFLLVGLLKFRLGKFLII